MVQQSRVKYAYLDEKIRDTWRRLSLLIGVILDTIEKIYQNVFLFDDDFYNYLAIIFVFEIHIYVYYIFILRNVKIIYERYVV